MTSQTKVLGRSPDLGRTSGSEWTRFAGVNGDSKQGQESEEQGGDQRSSMFMQQVGVLFQ